MIKTSKKITKISKTRRLLLESFEATFRQDPELALEMFGAVLLDRSDQGESLFKIPGYQYHVYGLKTKQSLVWVYVPTTIKKIAKIEDWIKDNNSSGRSARRVLEQFGVRATAHRVKPLSKIKTSLERLSDFRGPA